MDLKIKDVAKLLNVSETTIRRWLAEGKIPAYRLQHQYRFSRSEIENWMMSCRLNKDFDLIKAQEEHSIDSLQTQKDPKGWQQFSLLRAVHHGDAIINEHATNVEGLIRETMQEKAHLLSLDPEGITNMLLDREALMPTALNQGFAVPHTRDFLLKTGFDAIFIVFPKQPIDWKALDGEPVHTAFFLFASDDRHHLNLLAKLAHLSSNQASIDFLKTRPSKSQLLEFIKKWEQGVCLAEEVKA